MMVPRKRYAPLCLSELRFCSDFMATKNFLGHAWQPKESVARCFLFKELGTLLG